ncbi:MAG: DegT/DnrJ/EryC1/StrS family aminotransferase [Candidatus Bathyarchaeia archaeon]
MAQLAIEGGKPVRGPDNPLPSLWPREVGPNAMVYLQEWIKSGNTANFLSRFDEAFAKLNGAKYAIAVANCTVACHTALAAAGIGPGDEVVVSPISDYGTLYGVIAQRAIPVFADVDPLNGNVTGEDLEAVITDKTRAIILVHWAGITLDMDPILKVARKHGLPLIEDCCQAPLAKYKGKNAGTIGDMGCFSFDNEKHISCGTGGAVITDSEIYKKRISNFAEGRGAFVEDPVYGRRHKVLGCNYRFDGLRAAECLAQIEILPRQVDRRRELGAKLNKLLAEIDGIIPCPIPDGGDAVYWIFPFIVEIEKFSVSLDKFAAAISAEGLSLSSARYYLIPDSHDLLNDLKHTYTDVDKPGGNSDNYLGRTYSAKMTPKAKWYVEHMLRWNFTDKYTERDIEDIATIIRKVANRYRK